MAARLVVAILLLASLGGGLWWVASLAPRGGSGMGEFAVFVVAPDGGTMVNGSVHSKADPLSALQVLGAERNVTVDIEQRTNIGQGCTAAYVVAIGGVRETTTGGWNYYTRRPGGAWTWESAGAACYGLSPGQQVEWCWVESDVCRHHVP